VTWADNNHHGMNVVGSNPIIYQKTALQLISKIVDKTQGN